LLGSSNEPRSSANDPKIVSNKGHKMAKIQRYCTTHADGSYTNYEAVDVYQRKVKAGYRRIYMTMIDLIEVMSTPSDTKLLGLVMRKTSKVLTFDYTTEQLVKLTGFSAATVKRSIKKLIDNKLLKGSTGHYMVNPNVYVPYGVKADVVAELQYEWTLSETN